MTEYETILGKPIEQWLNEYAALPRSTFQEVLKLPPQAAVYLTLRFLRELPQPRRDMEEMLTWATANIPDYFQRASPTTTPVISSGKIVLVVHIDDTVQLRAKTEAASVVLERTGSWWKITQARIKPVQWFLRSLTRKEQGLAHIHKFHSENRWIHKQDDPEFEIVRVCPFLKDFNYREYK